MFKIFTSALGWLLSRVTQSAFVTSIISLILSKLALKLAASVAMAAAAHALVTIGFGYVPSTYQNTMLYFGFNDGIDIIIAASIARATYWVL